MNPPTGDRDGPTLADVGEEGLLARLFPLLPDASSAVIGPGDDAAVVAAPDGLVVATTDVLVQDRDFRLDWSSGEDVGVKAAAQNLADVAAMGAVPTALLVSLVAPPDTPVSWALGLARGLALGCEGTGAGVVGGDLSSGSQLVVCVTAFGDLQGREPVLRSGARVGDVVAVAGELGRSAAGLALLRAGRDDLDPALVTAHRRPSPPLAAGPAAARAGATALLDVSDGLLRDLDRIAAASGVSVDLDGDEGPLAHRRQALEAVADELGGGASLAWEWVLTGGEDHALVACFPSGTDLPQGYEVIGTVLPRLVGRPLVEVDGNGRPEGTGGWDHFGG